MPELAKAYQPKDFETSTYQRWEQSGFFNPDNLLKKGEPFSISLPPPNATGILHLGHAVMIAIQDLMIRYWRLRGRAALWLPGEDHAAIATQNVVEKKLHKEDGKTRYDYGRDEFIKRVNEFIASSRSTIRDQIKAMGASCDWSRERYTLDEGLSRAVREVFVRMYHDGLIYRGKRIVNWCYRCGTTLADDEVEYKEQKTPFYYLKYGPITISTARPETKVLDKVIIVHPDDKRYQGYIGKSFDVPWIDGMVKATVVADKVAEMETGTGAMTITPAHSFVDFELAQKYGFEIVDIIGPDGKLTANAGKFAGLNVKEARIAILDELKKKDLVEKIDEEYIHNLSICYRCGTPVEPLPSEQWFVAVDKPFKRGLFHRTTLKKLAIAAVSTGKIKIVPERFAKIYDHWMKNLHDWCISRQIWFGHRVPAWKCISCGEWFVGQAKPSTCLKCKASNLEQDPDTLDTWFSSSLWTFSTLGWPDKTKDLATYHPTSVMETGYDILFFWIARMVLMTQYSLGDIPFRTVYLHGLVRDKQGRKMSKSLGNGIDPIAMIDKYGADALRLSMIIGTTPGNDFRLYDEKIAGYRNFVNKLWNIVRFANLTAELKIVEIPPEAKTLADKWILSRFARVADLVTKKIESYSFSEAGEALYDFTWHELADWYLEVAKIEGNKQKILSYLITQLLKLWHPFTPYVTETLWRETFGEAAGLLMVQSWPEKLPAPADDPGFEIIRDVVTALRGFRVEHKLGPDKVINFAVTKDKYRIIESYTHLVQGLRTTTIAKPINQLSNGERLVVREGVELIVSFDKLDK
ncbi:MAG: valine--tRNA ligase [Candidatus Veblenbacteria bacterium RIFOXYC1_FULL_42_9]|uniref:Valine--tRNA ligase n=1 Tax=Candidatus Veblenbacteria bacterium RIFOXYC1_FULL_42_9 TaxID=1802427 RepID=A0A1G2Q6M6_9BACT|nr:MAG: valine--tRNA ligase [Candidatus Veblenbacteria bacterium RIFOXYC1_FULL_42_9]